MTGSRNGIVERLGRARSLPWLGPVLLFVLLAAAGMPERAIGGGPPQSAALREDGWARSPAHPIETAWQCSGDAVAVLPGGQPRIVPRTRSVTEAGLPSPRAPTA